MVDELFQRKLPRTIAEQLAAFACMRGSIGIQIGDAEAWTIRLGELKQPIRHGLDNDVDLRLEFSHAAFAAFIAGTLDVAAAYREGELRFDGTIDLLEKLGRLLSAPSNAIQTRAAYAAVQ